MLLPFSKENQDGYRTENISNVRKERIQLLKKTKFEEKLQREFEELTVRIDEKSNQILFKGPTDKVTEAKTRYDMLNSEVTDKILQFPPYILKVLNTNTASKAIEVEMAVNKVDAVFVLEEDGSTSRRRCKGNWNFIGTSGEGIQAYKKIYSRNRT